MLDLLEAWIAGVRRSDEERLSEDAEEQERAGGLLVAGVVRRLCCG